MYKNRLLIVVSFLMLMSCENPFLPKTGVPLNVSNPRSTPAGVISQLFQSYETRRIELFTSVLSKGFKFYVASGFNRINLTAEKPDTFMRSVDTLSSYYYWEYDEEYKRTSKMFENAEMIEIPSRPTISNTNYIFDSSGDTIYAEIKVNNVTFEVSRYESGNTLVTYSLDNQPQVFLLERDKDKLWVIKKWYDLGSE